jgi:hypothetical protein
VRVKSPHQPGRGFGAIISHRSLTPSLIRKKTSRPGFLVPAWHGGLAPPLRMWRGNWRNACPVCGRRIVATQHQLGDTTDDKTAATNALLIRFILGHPRSGRNSPTFSVLRGCRCREALALTGSGPVGDVERQTDRNGDRSGPGRSECPWNRDETGRFPPRHHTLLAQTTRRRCKKIKVCVS